MLYSTSDRELFAAFSAVKHFGFFLEGRPFTLFIDLKPLVSAISKSKTPFSSRQQRQLAFLSDLPGHHNVVADILSRSSQPSATILPATPSAATVSPAVSTSLFPLPLSYTDIAKAHAANMPIHPCPAQPAFLAHHFHTFFITALTS
jgi:hypothetical protein